MRILHHYGHKRKRNDENPIDSNDPNGKTEYLGTTNPLTRTAYNGRRLCSHSRIGPIFLARSFRDSISAVPILVSGYEYVNVLV